VINGQRTGYRHKRVPWSSLFDSGKEKLQDELTSKLSDGEFKELIIYWMKKGPLVAGGQSYELKMVSDK